MRRFAKNRWWAFILTLIVLLASSATLTAPSYADGSEQVITPDGGSGGAPPAGDPDGPSGPGKKSPTGGYVHTGGTGFMAVTSVGDGGPAWRVWSWRFHVVLLSLRARYFRF
jgi:hypothetical protein